MSFVTRRALSTLIPPKASPSPHPRVLDMLTDNLQVASPSVSSSLHPTPQWDDSLIRDPYRNNRGIKGRIRLMAFRASVLHKMLLECHA